MRLARLELLAFGPFTDVALDLDPGDPGGAGGAALHLVYGANEAGKSTTLRALGGLLYGIPERTPDDWVHPKKKLRLGATLVSAAGERLEVVRRKGRKNTLLDASGEPVDEARLARLLAGVSAERFRTVFALDHETLREGGEDLLAGGGDVGESLFDAGAGVPGVHALLEELEAEAASLFVPRGQNPKLNEALAELAEAKSRIRLHEVSAAAWREQEAEIAAKRAECAEHQTRRAALVAERSRLDRDLRVLPLLAQRAELVRARAALGELPPLAPDVAAARARAEHERELAERDVRRLAAEVRDLAARRDRVDVPEELLALSDEAAEALDVALGRARAAAADLPKREAELRAAQDEVRAALARLGRGDELDDLAALRVDAAREARVRELARQRVEREGERREARSELRRAEERLARLRASLAEAGAPRETTALARELGLAKRLGEIEERLVALTRTTAELERETAARAAALGGWSGALADAPALPVPAPETIERFAEEARELAAARGRCEERRTELGRRRREAERELRAERAAGEVPSEERLAAARRERAERWRAIRDGAAADGPAGDALEEAVAHADELADRLRRESRRVARWAELEARRVALDEEQAELEREVAALAEREAAQESAWRAAWEPSGVAPASPREMTVWRARLAELAARALELDAARAEHATLAERLRERRAALAAALAGQGAAPPEDAGLAELVERAERACESERAAAVARARLVEEIDGEERALAEARARDARSATELQSWTAQWGGAVAVLGLGPEASAAEAASVLDGQAELFRRVDDAARLRRRVEGLRVEATHFAAEVAELAERYLPAAAALPPLEAAATLVKRHRAGREAERARERIAADLAAREAELAARTAAGRTADDELAALVHAAGAADLAALRDLERRIAEARELDLRLEEVERTLLEQGDGASLAELVAETGSVRADVARARRDALEARVDALDERLRDASKALGVATRGLEYLQEKSAAEAADDAQECLARVREHGAAWVRAKLAAVLLRREIERWREENQGPILQRAGELFPRLTLGRYTGLRAGWGDGDRPVLRCLRGADEVGVDGLSDGTRDQLYLALRVASLEHQAAHDEPLPFVVDDVLVHFDDDRARAALAVLGELAATTQVLFFTHHARLRELAREAVPAGRLVEHELPSPPLAAALEPPAG